MCVLDKIENLFAQDEIDRIRRDQRVGLTQLLREGLGLQPVVAGARRMGSQAGFQLLQIEL